MRAIGLLLLSTALVPALHAETPSQISEPSSGVRFDARSGDLQLLGVALRTKTFLKVKVYAVGLYVDPAGLAAFRAQPSSAALFQQLVWGDFRREIRMKFIRSSVTAEQIRGAFREGLAGADKTKVESFVAFFGDTKAGDEYVLSYVPGGVIETSVAGQPKAPIADKAFAAAVFSIWLGEKPIQEDIKRGLVARAAEVVR
jgi:hypothetical protein